MKTVEKFNSSSFGDYLRSVRLESTYSQDKMACFLGVSQNAYCLIENGRTKVTLEHIQKLAMALETRPWELLEGFKRYVYHTDRSSG